MQVIEIPDGVLKRYLRHLDRAGVDDVLVTGGALRDTLLGVEPHDIDVAVRITLPEPQHAAFLEKVEAGVPAAALMRECQLFYRAEQVIARHARAANLGNGWSAPTRDGRFENTPVQFCFAEAVIGDRIINLGMNAAFTIDAMAVDRRGRLYEAPGQQGLDDLAQRRLRLANRAVNDPYKPSNWSLWTVLRVLRYRYQYGFELDGMSGLMEQAGGSLTRSTPPTFKNLRAMIGLELMLAKLDPSLRNLHYSYAVRRAYWFARTLVPSTNYRELKWFDRFLDALPPDTRRDALQELERLRVFECYPDLARKADAACREWRPLTTAADRPLIPS